MLEHPFTRRALERAYEVGTTGLERRQKPSPNARADGHHGGEGDNAPIDRRCSPEKLGEHCMTQRRARPEGDEYRHGATECGDDHTLGEQLADKTTAAHTERQTH